MKYLININLNVIKLLIEKFYLVQSVNIFLSETQPFDHSIPYDVYTPFQIQTGASLAIQDTAEGLLQLRSKVFDVVFENRGKQSGREDLRDVSG